jgi:dephospho-CoA kinase
MPSLFSASIFRGHGTMLIVGLTGGVASGKTAVSKILSEEGAYIIDADQIARELVQPHTPLWSELIRVFGKKILDQDGSMHRKKLAAIVFSDPQQRNLLNQMMHPRIKEEIDRRVEGIGQKDPEAIVVIDAALLVELGYHREMDKLIVVASTVRQQIERLKEREGASEEEARKILSSQMILDEKLKVADFVIPNEGSLEETRRMAKEVFQELKRMALQKGERLKSQGSS